MPPSKNSMARSLASGTTFARDFFLDAPDLVARRLLGTSGPGRLCQAFGIARANDNGADLTSPESNLQIQDGGFKAGEILVTHRIGISKEATRPRFLLAGNSFVSRYKS